MMIFCVYEIGFRSRDAFRGHGSNYFFSRGREKNGFSARAVPAGVAPPLQPIYKVSNF